MRVYVTIVNAYGILKNAYEPGKGREFFNLIV